MTPRMSGSHPGCLREYTATDCYMVASGLLEEDEDHAVTMLRFAAAMQRGAAEVRRSGELKVNQSCSSCRSRVT